MRAVYAFPLRLRDDCIGAMNRFRHELGHFSPADVEAAQADIGPDAAFELLRDHARTNQRRVRQVAQEIIDGTLPPSQ